MPIRRPDIAAITSHLRVPPTPGRFEPATTSPLPAEAQRYLKASIADGARLVQAARITMGGEIKLGSRWVGFTGEELLAPHHGFCWTARTRLGITGSDHYADGDGALDWRLFGVVPVMRASGRDVARSAAGRAGGEAVWIPTSLVPEAGATWTARDGNGRVAVHLDTGGHGTTSELTVDERGMIRQVSFQRWGDPDGTGTFSLHDFGMDVTDHATFGELTIPASGVVGWHHGTERWPEGAFFRYELTAVDPITEPGGSARRG